MISITRLPVLILASAQALFQIASIMVVTVGGLAGAAITSRPELATAPIAAMFLGTVAATFPASLWMARVGRRWGFVAGALLGALGGLIGALGVWKGSLGLLSLGTFLVGTYQGFAQFYRFAASEVAEEGFRPRAVALVLAGGVAAALVGPWLSRIGVPLLEVQYAGAFIILTVVSLLAAGLLAGLRVPAGGQELGSDAPRRAWREIVVQPTYLVALFGAATGFGVMVLAMTATPLAMVHEHHSLDAASTVIQFHMLGMFLPSFFTGSLIARFGVMRIMLAGLALLASHVLITLTGTGFISFVSALTILGIGWNFLYIGGTTLLTSAYRPSEKSTAQAMNDMTIFIVGLGCSFGAGALLETYGWVTMNLMLLPWIAVAAGTLIWTRSKAPALRLVDTRR
jgi:MFS family permease